MLFLILKAWCICLVSSVNFLKVSSLSLLLTMESHPKVHAFSCLTTRTLPSIFGNLLKILRFKSLVLLCVYMLLSINKQCTFVSCGKIISLCTVDNSSFSFLTSFVWLCVSQVQPHWVRHYEVISIMRPPYRSKHLILIIKTLNFH